MSFRSTFSKIPNKPGTRGTKLIPKGFRMGPYEVPKGVGSEPQDTACALVEAGQDVAWRVVAPGPEDEVSVWLPQGPAGHGGAPLGKGLLATDGSVRFRGSAAAALDAPYPDASPTPSDSSRSGRLPSRIGPLRG